MAAKLIDFDSLPQQKKRQAPRKKVTGEMLLQRKLIWHKRKIAEQAQNKQKRRQFQQKSHMDMDKFNRKKVEEKGKVFVFLLRWTPNKYDLIYKRSFSMVDRRRKHRHTHTQRIIIIYRD